MPIWKRQRPVWKAGGEDSPHGENVRENRLSGCIDLHDERRFGNDDGKHIQNHGGGIYIGNKRRKDGWK